MGFFDIVAALVTLVALFSWVNRRWIHLPTAIGLMLIALLFSLGLVVLGRLGVPVEQPFLELVGSIDFGRAFLHGMLGAMLFAGALHVEFDDLMAERHSISILATAGVLLSTAMIGGASWWMLKLLDVPISLTACLLFGALMAPTDPIAVLAILRDAGVPKALETKLVGEALFNDGVGVVLFLLIADFASAGHAAGVSDALLLGLRETAGGIAYGGLLGAAAFRILKSVDDYAVEILVTLAVVTGGYALAEHLRVSGPLAMVVAGLLLGNRGREQAMSQNTRERVDGFWELVDAFLNATLFVLIGLEVVALDFDPRSLAAGLVAIPLVLASRFLAIGGLVLLLRRWQAFEPHSVKILTWSGLRGGISVALALSLPHGPERDLILATTYLVVSASILVQGLTLGRLVRFLRA
ncbi:MAG: sodium:proton antiporter [Acidobacteriota bacterium]|jgi:CPA1 family monovalent cation:H+ antiporter